jgi:hypothetical protein
VRKWVHIVESCDPKAEDGLVVPSWATRCLCWIHLCWFIYFFCVNFDVTFLSNFLNYFFFWVQKNYFVLIYVIANIFQCNFAFSCNDISNFLILCFNFHSPSTSLSVLVFSETKWFASIRRPINGSLLK